jgi:uncharacterized protein YjaZ
LLEAIVSEGLADAFAREAYPLSPLQPWVQALDLAAQHRWWAVAELGAPDTRVVQLRWFFGSSDVPRWAGYTFGYELVRSYLVAHPGATAAGLLAIGASTLLLGSGYNP